jgi:hypothetical protein
MTTELKTLKDLTPEIPKGLTCVCGECDLKIVRVKDLKSEAIKWVKFYERKYPNVQAESRVDWIKYFFNLTEEDLK